MLSLLLSEDLRQKSEGHIQEHRTCQHMES